MTVNTTIKQVVTDFNTPATSKYFSSKTAPASWLGTGSYTIVYHDFVNTNELLYIWFD